jgi:hypothetical protein
VQIHRPSHALTEAIDAYDAAGGVLDYVIFESPSVPSSTDHRTAARLAIAMEEIRRELEKPPSTFRLRVGDTPDVPDVVSVRDFVGPLYDWNTEELIDPWVNGCREGHGELMTHGYADAFLDPPYRLRIARSEATTLFQGINRELFGGLTDELVVRSWPTDWSNYFDAGLDWWGTFYWTVYVGRTNRLIVIAASSTD